MASEGELERAAKHRIEAGELPCAPVARMWGSRGTGARCALCGKPVRPEEVEYEVAFIDDNTERTLRFHLSCHSIWHAECLRVDRAHAGA